MLPRSGGVLDQPAHEMIKLERVLGAFNEWEKIASRKMEAKNKLDNNRPYKGIDQ